MQDIFLAMLTNQKPIEGIEYSGSPEIINQRLHLNTVFYQPTVKGIN